MGIAILLILLSLSRFALPCAVGIGAIALAGIFMYNIFSREIKSKAMDDIAGDIRKSAYTYLARQTKTIAIFTPFLAGAMWLLLGWQTAFTMVLGVVTSLLAGFIGMSVCLKSNVQSADLAEESVGKAFNAAILGGSVMGFLVTGLSLFVLSILFRVFNNPSILIGFGFGASLAALFAQIGGGIFTKSADIGADLVGKVEKKIPEDDPRNPAVIADLVGDNVGDCAGRGSDLFQTFSDDIVTGSIVAAALVPRFGIGVLYFPILLQCIGVVSSAIGILATKEWNHGMAPQTRFNIGLLVSSALSMAGAMILARLLLGSISIGISAVLGVATTLVAATTTRYYAGIGGKPVREISNASKSGPALTLIIGIAYGLRSPLASIVMIVVAILLAYKISAGLLLAVVAVNIGTDLLIAYIMASDAFGPIVDNAHGIAEFSDASPKVTRALSKLDSVGNTMKATTKAYAMSSGTVTAFVIFATFFSIAGIKALDVVNPYVLGFLLIGIALPFLISSLVIESTAKTARLMVEEVRRQFRENKLIIERKAKPDYSRCVDIATKNALKEMILPGAISILVPVIVGRFFGPTALGGLLIGAVACSALLGPFFNNVGTAWDNAKKLIEEKEELKWTAVHAAAVVGDTVGDPLKDVAGPSILIFMKMLGMASLLIITLIR